MANSPLEGTVVYREGELSKAKTPSTGAKSSRAVHRPIAALTTMQGRCKIPLRAGIIIILASPIASQVE